MKNRDIIYNQLEQLLFSLGFNPVETQGNHKAYSHPNSKALILLPNYKSTDTLNIVHYLAVRRTLREYDLMDEIAYENWFNTGLLSHYSSRDRLSALNTQARSVEIRNKKTPDEKINSFQNYSRYNFNNLYLLLYQRSFWLFFILAFISILLLAYFGYAPSLFFLSSILILLPLISLVNNYVQNQQKIPNSVDLSGFDLSNKNLSGRNFNGFNLSETNLVGANLSGTSLNKAKVKDAKFGYNKGISESMRQELIARGAIFIDSLNDYSQTPTSTE